MAEIPRKQLPEQIGAVSAARVTLSSLVTFLRNYDDSGRKITGPDNDSVRLSPALINGSQSDRELYGSIFVDHALSIAMTTAPLEQAPVLVQRAPLVTSALQKLLEERRNADTPELKTQFRNDNRDYIRAAAERRRYDPLVDAAMQTADVLKSHSAEPLATDVVAALGKVASDTTQEELADRTLQTNEEVGFTVVNGTGVHE